MTNAVDHTSDEKVQAALDWLTAHAHGAAKARAEFVHLNDYTKSLKSRLMIEAKADDPKLAVAMAEAMALSSPEYIQHLEAVKLAAETDALYRWRKDAARAVLDAFQTFSSNKRAERIV